MAEPTVQVPVSLIQRIAASSMENPDEDALIELSHLLSQPTTSAEHDRDEPAVPRWADLPDVDTTRTPKPLHIEDMAPGTTFNCPERWTVGPPTLQGRQWAFRSGEGRYLDEFDPSTIRDVQPPKET